MLEGGGAARPPLQPPRNSLETYGDPSVSLPSLAYLLGVERPAYTRKPATFISYLPSRLSQEPASTGDPERGFRLRAGSSRSAHAGGTVRAVATALCRVATSSPLNHNIEIAGPEVFRFDELIRRRLNSLNDSREVVADPHAPYFGTQLSERSIVPGDTARLGETYFEAWLKSPASQPPRRAATTSST